MGRPGRRLPWLCVPLVLSYVCFGNILRNHSNWDRKPQSIEPHKVQERLGQKTPKDFGLQKKGWFHRVLVHKGNVSRNGHVTTCHCHFLPSLPLPSLPLPLPSLPLPLPPISHSKLGIPLPLPPLPLPSTATYCHRCHCHHCHCHCHCPGDIPVYVGSRLPLKRVHGRSGACHSNGVSARHPNVRSNRQPQHCCSGPHASLADHTIQQSALRAAVSALHLDMSEGRTVFHGVRTSFR